MDAGLKAKWVSALRSSEFTQYRGGLCNRNPNPTSYCCLGVLWAISGHPNRINELWARNMNPLQKAELIGMNDSALKNFPEIADYIEEANL